MATTSQKMMDMRFFVLMRGALTPPPRIDDPVTKMPHAAPTTDRPMHSAMPKSAHANGDTASRKPPTYIVDSSAFVRNGTTERMRCPYIKGLAAAGKEHIWHPIR